MILTVLDLCFRGRWTDFWRISKIKQGPPWSLSLTKLVTPNFLLQWGKDLSFGERLKCMSYADSVQL